MRSKSHICFIGAAHGVGQRARKQKRRGAHTSIQSDILGDAKCQAPHNPSNMSAVTIAIICVVITIHRIATQGPCPCKQVTVCSEASS